MTYAFPLWRYTFQVVDWNASDWGTKSVPGQREAH